MPDLEPQDPDTDRSLKLRLVDLLRGNGFAASEIQMQLGHGVPVPDVVARRGDDAWIFEIKGPKESFHGARWLPQGRAYAPYANYVVFVVLASTPSHVAFAEAEGFGLYVLDDQGAVEIVAPRRSQGATAAILNRFRGGFS